MEISVISFEPLVASQLIYCSTSALIAVNLVRSEIN